MTQDTTYGVSGLRLEQGGARAAVGSGGSLDIESGGELDIESGGALKIAGSNKTAALAAAVAAPVAGVAAGYKIARGTLTPDAASKTVVTGLATVVAAIAQLKGAPTINHSMVAADIGDQAGTPAAGSILIKSYKPTSNSDPTPASATGSWVAVDWIAIGT